MKAQLFASAALVLLNAIPGALSAKVSRHLTLTSLSNDFCVMFAHVLTHLLIRLPSHHTSLQPQLRGVILATDFEDQLDLYDSKDEDLSEDFDFEATEPYEEDEFDSSEDYKMEPYEENFYGRRDGGGSGGYHYQGMPGGMSGGQGMPGGMSGGQGMPGGMPGERFLCSV